MPAMHAKLKKPKWSVAEALDALSTLVEAELTPAELKTLARFTQDLADREFERRLTALKATRDGSALPKDVLAHQLIGQAQYRTPCQCQWLLNQND